MNINKDKFSENVLKQLGSGQGGVAVAILVGSAVDRLTCEGCSKGDIKNNLLCVSCSRNPHLEDNFIAKPKDKITDLQPFVFSGMDMEFQGAEHGKD